MGGAVVVAADQVEREVQEGRADARGCRSGKGKEIAGEEAATEDGGDGRATSAGPGDVGGGGKGKERADNGSIQAQRGSRKRAAQIGDEGESNAGRKRARGRTTRICHHNRERSRCKECGGSSICQHLRRRSECKECRGGSICQHNRIRSKCKTCIADKDESMPLGLEEL